MAYRIIFKTYYPWKNTSFNKNWIHTGHFENKENPLQCVYYLAHMYQNLVGLKSRFHFVFNPIFN